MKFTKKILAAAFLSSTLLMTGCGQVNIGYVDGARVMEESPQIKAVIEENEQKISLYNMKEAVDRQPLIISGAGVPLTTL